MADKNIPLLKKQQGRPEVISVTGLDTAYDVETTDDDSDLPEAYIWLARFDFKQKPGKQPKNKKYKVVVRNQVPGKAYFLYTGKGDPFEFDPAEGYSLEVGDPAIGIAK